MRPSASIRLSAITLALVVFVGPGCGPSGAIRPNLVLITVDAVRPDWLPCYGAPTAIGAEVCALGDRGALFARVFATSPSGAPSAASILTSTYPTQHGVTDDPATFLASAGPQTLAESLRRAGYTTAAFVGSPELNRSRHLGRGFDRFDDRSATPKAAADVPIGLRARSWTAIAPEPWFIWIHFADLHGPFGTKEPGAYRAAYGEALRRLDRQLSQLIAVLDSSLTPPGILLTALHGQGLGEHGSALGHGTALGPDQIRVPLLWRSPRAAAGTGVGRRVTRSVSLIDVAPTLLESAGLRAPASFEGTPLPHSDAGNGTRSERTLFAERPDAIAVIHGRDLAVFPRFLVPRPSGADPGPAREYQIRLPALNDRGGAELHPGAHPRPAADRSELRAALRHFPTSWHADDHRELARQPE